MIATSLPRRGGIRIRNSEPVPPGPARDAESRLCRKIAPPVAAPPPNCPAQGGGEPPARSAVRRGRSSRPSRRYGGIRARPMRSQGFWAPGFQALAAYRLGVNGLRNRVLRVPARLLYRFLSLSARNVNASNSPTAPIWPPSQDRPSARHRDPFRCGDRRRLPDPHGVTIGGLGGSRAGRSAGAPRLGDRVGVGCARAASRRGTAARREQPQHRVPLRPAVIRRSRPGAAAAPMSEVSVPPGSSALKRSSIQAPPSGPSNVISRLRCRALRTGGSGVRGPSCTLSAILDGSLAVGRCGRG